MTESVGFDWLALMLEPIAHATWFAPTCSAAILAAAAALIFVLARRLDRPVAALAQARALVEKSESPAEFFAAFERVDLRLAEDPILGHAWTEFAKTLLRSPEDAAIRYTVRPGHFFESEDLAGGVVNLDMIRAVPNYLVGIGLLFTFLGLVAALYFAGQGVTARDIHDAQAALKQLLQAATFKFMTSIAGLGGSIVFSIAKKRLIARLERHTEAFCMALERRMGLITPVALAEASHRELVRFNAELGRSIATHLDETIGRTMGAVMAPMALLLERMTENMAELNREAIERMLLMFTERLQGAAAQEMSRLIEALQAVHGSIGGLVRDIDTGRRAIAEELTRTSADLGRSLAAAGEAAGERMRDAGANVESRLARGAEAVESSVTRFAATAGTLESQMLRGANAIETSVARAGGDFSSQLATAGETVENRLSATAGRVEHVLGGAAETFSGAMARSTAAFGDKVSTTIDSLGNTLDPLGKRLDAVQAGLLGLDDVITRQRDGLDRLVTEMATAVTTLKGAAGDIAGAADPLGQVVAGMGDGIALLSRAGERLTALEQEFATLTKLLGQVSGGLATAWEGTEHRFGTLDDNLAKVFEQLQAGLQTYRGGLDDFVTDVDRSMAQSVKLLGSAIAELSDTVDGLTALRKLDAERM